MLHLHVTNAHSQSVTELNSLQQVDLELQAAEDVSQAVRLRQQAAGVRDLGGVDLRVVLLHAGQAEHVAGYQEIGL